MILESGPEPPGGHAARGRRPGHRARRRKARQPITSWIGGPTRRWRLQVLRSESTRRFMGQYNAASRCGLTPAPARRISRNKFVIVEAVDPGRDRLPRSSPTSSRRSPRRLQALIGEDPTAPTCARAARGRRRATVRCSDATNLAMRAAPRLAMREPSWLSSCCC